MREILTGSQAQQDVDIGETHVSVHDHNLVAALRQRHREVNCHIALTDTTLAAGHRDYLDGLLCFHLSNTLCLIHCSSYACFLFMMWL